MSENTFRSSPQMTPDSLRQKLHMDKAFYELHTKKYFGRQDINGLEYAGTVENFGSEMLLESRKMRMLRPPLSDIVTNHYMAQYFNLKYADEINTYNQMNMVTACLDTSMMLSDDEDREMVIVFKNITVKRMLRSRFDSDTNVVNRCYYETKTPPVLQYKTAGGVVLEKDLIAHDQSGEDTTYYFAITINGYSTLEGVIGRRLTDDEYRRAFINPDKCDFLHGTIVTVPLTQEMDGLPFIWMTFPSYNTLPKYVIENNVDYYGRPLLEIGTNGHHQSFLYPFAYGTDNIPRVPADQQSELRGWSLRIYAKNDMFLENEYERNLNVAIRKVQFIYGPKLQWTVDSEEAFHTVNLVEPTLVHTLEIPENEFVRITLTDFSKYAWNIGANGKQKMKWHFRAPKSGEWDYDGTLFQNPVYATIYEIDEFFKYNSCVGLFSKDSDQYGRYIPSMYHAFDVLFNQDYFDTFDGVTENAVAGMHIDYTSDYSMHAVDKKNGTIYNLGDFDGLPTYYRIYQGRNINHGRIEIYAIRDDINNTNQTSMERQTSALIIDAGIPQYTVQTINIDLNPVIQFDHNRYYHTTAVSVSANNSLTDLAWLRNRSLGDVQKSEYSSLTRKLIYHGNRYYSLSMVGLSPNETARVYAITNDPAYYENNDTTDRPKPPRTLARICDIPTEYGQLTHIQGISPTFVADPYYIHSDCDYTIADQECIWNLNTDDHMLHGVVQNTTTYVFENDDDLNILASKGFLNMTHTRMSNLNRYMDMRVSCKTSIEKDDYEDVGYRLLIEDQGKNYVNGSMFTLYIGGIAVVGTVVSQEGSAPLPVDNYVIGYDENRMIHIANLKPRDQVYHTTTTKYCGYGLTMTIDIDNEIWSSLQPRRDQLLSDIYTFKKDIDGNIWVWNFVDDHWVQGTQLTGPKTFENVYDDEDTQNDRKYLPAILHNTFRTRETHASEEKNFSYELLYGITSIHDETIEPDDPGTDISELIFKSGADYQDAYYTLTKYVYSVDVNAYTPIETGDDSSKLMFHKNHMFTEYEHYPRTNELLIDTINDEIPDDRQPTLEYYNPFIDTIVEVSPICTDVVAYNYKHDLTFMDLDKDLVTFSGSSSSSIGRLTKTVYKYNGFQQPKRERDLSVLLSLDSVPRLMTYIHQTFGDNCEPTWYDRTEFAYTAPMLQNYIRQNIAYEPAYYPNMVTDTPITKLRNINEEVVSAYGRSYEAIGEQPTGAYMQPGTQIFNPHMVTNYNTYVESTFTYIFRIDDVIQNLNRFRMYDDINDVDISENTLLIYRNTLYVFNTYSQTWEKIVRNRRD